MQKFFAYRNVPELRAECRRRGWTLSTKRWRGGDDCVSFRFTVGRVSGLCVFNTFNGSFVGELDESPTLFSSSSDRHEKSPWYRALLHTCYHTRPRRKKGERQCLRCGCTDSNCRGCIQRTGKACHWINEHTCSACATKEELRQHQRSLDKQLKPLARRLAATRR
jgi:hypothetical protein